MSEHSQNTANEFKIPEKLLQVGKGKPPRRSDSLRSQIPKVPQSLRLEKNNQQEYDPVVVSFGPYHHGKPEFEAAEDLKLKALEMFVEETGKDVGFYYDKVCERVHDARNCYIENSTHAFDESTFAQMMLLDACFIIIFIILRKSYMDFNIAHGLVGDFFAGNVIRDMRLLENQIPFWIIKLVLCLGYGEDRSKELLNKFVLADFKWIEIGSSEEEQPFHLLDFLRRGLVYKCGSSVKPIPPCPTPSFGWLKCIGNTLGKCSHLQLHCCILWRRKDDNENVLKKYVHSFRSVTDLKAKGIHFRPSSTGNYLKGIKFKSGYFFAQLEVPFFFATIYTKSYFLNMIAYERLCLSTSRDRVVTAYIDFMKSLIDNPKDVKELREKKILFTILDSDEEVVKIFKEINTGQNYISMYQNVKKEIQAHYNNKVKTWLAELLHTYFTSPWSAIALFAATCLLVLTFLQTYFTIKSSSD